VVSRSKSPSNLPNADRQAACFRNVARVRDPDGAFVIECFVPDFARYDLGQQKITFDSQGTRLHPVALRYCWPSELDLMAGQAGLRLRERYADWDRRPFASDSASHVSVYRPG
jgi:hypothetical protein